MRKYYISKFFALSVILMMNLNLINAQSRSIKGYVCNDSGDRLPGAIVRLVGEDDNIITDANGEFSAELSNGTKYLLVEYVGYSTKKIKINDKLNLYVKLDRDVSNKYQEVNLIKDVRPSYSVGGSAIVITGDELRKTHNHHLAAALAGRVSPRCLPGVHFGDLPMTRSTSSARDLSGDLNISALPTEPSFSMTNVTRTFP